MTDLILPLVPPGINVRVDRSDTYNYAIPPMQTDCWPVRLIPDWDQVIIVCVQNSFWSQQQGSVRAWLSITPNDSNIIPMERRDRTVRLQGIGSSWLFHRFGKEPIGEAQIVFPVDPFAVGDAAIPGYWMNFQNTSGQENSYYFQSTYSNSGATLVE